MLEKFVLTLSSLLLVTTLGGGLVWAQGGFEAPTDLSSVARESGAAGSSVDDGGRTGFGTADSLASAAPRPRVEASARRAARRRQGPAATAGPVPRATLSQQVPVVQSPVAPSPLAQAPVTPAPAGAVTGSTGSATSAEPAAGGGPSFVLASFNLLGSSHTRGSSGRASGPTRMSGALQVLAQHDITVAGFQEFQPDQRATFDRLASGWSTYPGTSMGRRAGENSVAWRRDTWDLVSTGLVQIPYFGGRERPMPYVLLRHKSTGRTVYVSTFHNPADVHGPAQRWRTEATTREVALFNRLAATGVPQVVTGDMNERDNYFCRVTAEARLHAAAGGTHDGDCRPSRPVQIDWIFGSRSVTFSDYTVDRSPLVRRTTDHPVVLSRVTLPKP